MHAQPGEGIERAERLVHQQQRRARHHRAGERGPVLHPSGQLMREGVAELIKTDGGQDRVGLGLQLGIVPLVESA